MLAREQNLKPQIPVDSIKITPPNLFLYTDYRKYLLDFYTYKKTLKPHVFSYRYFNKMAGFRGPNYLLLIIQGKRNLSKNSLPKVVEALNLSENETQYFVNLVNFNQARTTENKEKHYNNLLLFKEFQDVHYISDQQHKYLEFWYTPVIREMIKFEDFQPNAKWIAAQVNPVITEEEALKALNILLETGLAEIDATGSWQQAYPSIETQANAVLDGAEEYQNKMIQMSLDVNKDATGMTMSVSPMKKKIIESKIEEFKKTIQRIVTQSDLEDQFVLEMLSSTIQDDSKELGTAINEVLHINIQAFSLTSKGNKDENLN